MRNDPATFLKFLFLKPSPDYLPIKFVRDSKLARIFSGRAMCWDHFYSKHGCLAKLLLT